MSATTEYLAIDLGASSGRGVVGSFNGSRLALHEVHRFPNTPISLPTGLHWDTPRLFEEIKHSLTIAARSSGELAGIGIDTWGVDYALLSSAGELLGLPHHYRDPRTNGAMEEVFKLVPRERIYERTGIQFMALNTLYQMHAERKCGDGRLELARKMLFTPDLLNYWLTGEQRTERTIASTSQFYDTGTNTWADDIVRAVGIPERLLPEIATPGSTLGPLRRALADEVGVRSVAVILPGSHDTASAVAAAPGGVAGNDGDRGAWAYISSGTWSLVGRELTRPVRTPAALAANFTNETGVEGTIRFHKNIAGLWLLQECQRVWAMQGRSYTFEQMAEMAKAASPFGVLVDPDDGPFGEVCDMPARIAAYAVRTGQRPPDSDAAVVRCIFESLALKYRMTIELLEGLTGAVGTIHVVGGGSRNELLCQLTADACSRVVIAGPVEATAAGNVMVQALAQRRVSSLAEIRAVVAASFPQVTYTPRPNAHRSGWDDAWGRFQRLFAR